jgi:Family of unknown function (DUF6527)
MEAIQKMKVKNFDECKNTGDWYFTDADADPSRPHRRLSFLCPCGCGMLAGIRVRNDGANDGQAWGWNKDEDNPTCEPSININDNHWHGYLTNGIFKSC